MFIANVPTRYKNKIVINFVVSLINYVFNFTLFKF